MFQPSWILAVLALLILAVTTHAQDTAHPGQRKLTKEEVDARAIAADKEIWQLTADTWDSRVSSDTWLIFYGATWCPHCKRLAPRWLKVQNQYSSQQLVDKDFYMAKVDCTNQADWCLSKTVDSYPTILLYHNGQRIEEYMGDYEPIPIWEYITQKASFYQQQVALDDGEDYEILEVVVEETVNEKGEKIVVEDDSPLANKVIGHGHEL